MSNLNWPAAVDDIASGARWLKGNGAKKVFVTGFCMGGALSLAAGVLVSEVDAVAPFYGTPNPGLADTAKCRVPVQGHYGDLDKAAGFADIAAAEALKTKLASAGVEHEVYRYPAVGHAFMNATPAGRARRAALGQGGHDAPSVYLAWSRLFTFFAKHSAVAATA